MIRKKFNLAALHYWDYQTRNKLMILYQGDLLRQYRELKAFAQENKCFYCMREMTPSTDKSNRRCTAEHLIPVAHGGKTEIDNIVAACWGCNHKRQISDWLGFLKTKHPFYIQQEV